MQRTSDPLVPAKEMTLMENNQKSDRKDQKSKMTPKRIAALVCALLLVALYLFTFVCALLSFPNWHRLFAACLVATIGLPILLWIYIWIYGKVTDRRTIASFDPGASGTDHPKKEP